MSLQNAYNFNYLHFNLFSISFGILFVYVFVRIFRSLIFRLADTDNNSVEIAVSQ